MRRFIMIFLILIFPVLILAQTGSTFIFTLESKSTGLRQPGRDVDLYQSGAKKYDLMEVAPGIYKNTQVKTGLYDIYVNGNPLPEYTNIFIGGPKLVEIVGKFDDSVKKISIDTVDVQSIKIKNVKRTSFFDFLNSSNKIESSGIENIPDNIVNTYKILDSSIIKADLNQQLIQYIDASGGGTITNYPDGITIGTNASNELFIKDDYKINVNSEILIVGSNQRYTSIQSAINSANSGSVIWVQAGTYNEKLTMKDGIAIVGIDKDQVIIHSTNGTAITVSSGDTCYIANVTIDAEGVPYNAISVSGSGLLKTSDIRVIGKIILSGNSYSIFNIAELWHRLSEDGFWLYDNATADIKVRKFYTYSQDYTYSPYGFIALNLYDNSKASIQSDNLNVWMRTNNNSELTIRDSYAFGLGRVWSGNRSKVYIYNSSFYFYENNTSKVETHGHHILEIADSSECYVYDSYFQYSDENKKDMGNIIAAGPGELGKFVAYNSTFVDFASDTLISNSVYNSVGYITFPYIRLKDCTFVLKDQKSGLNYFNLKLGSTSWATGTKYNIKVVDCNFKMEFGNQILLETTFGNDPSIANGDTIFFSNLKFYFDDESSVNRIIGSNIGGNTFNNEIYDYEIKYAQDAGQKSYYWLDNLLINGDVRIYNGDLNIGLYNYDSNGQKTTGVIRGKNIAIDGAGKHNVNVDSTLQTAKARYKLGLWDLLSTFPKKGTAGDTAVVTIYFEYALNGTENFFYANLLVYYSSYANVNAQYKIELASSYATENKTYLNVVKMNESNGSYSPLDSDIKILSQDEKKIAILFPNKYSDLDGHLFVHLLEGLNVKSIAITTR